MSISTRAINKLAQPFEGGLGPNHDMIERIWEAEDAYEYLGEGNKLERVLHGLLRLRNGRRASLGNPALPPDASKLMAVASELAMLLLANGLVAEEDVSEVLSGNTPNDRPAPQGALHTSEPPPRVDCADLDASDERSEAVGQAVADPHDVMVVHGRDDAAARAMFDWLRSVGLRPSEWNQLVKASGTSSPFIGDVLHRAFRKAQAVVVLFTPDEHVKLRYELSSEPWRLQPRPNVLLEAGMALATHPERTVLAVLGDQELPSDLAGRHYVQLGSPQALRDLGQRLEVAGCPVDLSGSDWLDTTRFPDRRALPRDP
jgi:predicted nucleotide-binding protein